MAEGPDGKTIIIVKKVSGHGGHHGGAWKVAYADFVTAMMALFMVLWLVNSASVRTRERIASYFKQPGIFDTGSGAPVEIGGLGLLPEPMLPPQEGNSQVQDPRIYKVESGGGPLEEGFTNDKVVQEQKPTLEKIASEIKEALSKNNKEGEGALGSVEIKIDQRGLHLDIMDTVTNSMFERGSPSITANAKTQLEVIAKSLQKLPNPIDIEGHTDAVPYRAASGKFYDNWDLSVDRANAARRILIASGVGEKQIARVVGYAAQRLRVPEKPDDFSNRRISLSMRYTDQAYGALNQTGLKPREFRPGQTQNIKETQPTVEQKPTSYAPPSRRFPLNWNPDQAKPEQDQEGEAAANSASSSGLHLEVRTSQPEGTPMTNDDSDRPSWIEKDKIFNGQNPFSK